MDNSYCTFWSMNILHNLLVFYHVSFLKQNFLINGSIREDLALEFCDNILCLFNKRGVVGFFQDTVETKGDAIQLLQHCLLLSHVSRGIILSTQGLLGRVLSREMCSIAGLICSLFKIKIFYF